MRKTLALGALVFCFLGLIFPLQALAQKLIFPKDKLIDNFDEFVQTFSSRRCQACHPRVYHQWEQSYHARSLVDSIKRMASFFAVGIPKEWQKPLNKKEMLKCFDCHLPQIRYATDRLALEIVGMLIEAQKARESGDKVRFQKAYSRLSRLNITCYACHNIVVYRASPGLFGKPDPQTIYTSTPKKIKAPHATAFAPTLKTAAFCAWCHGIYVASDGEKTMCNTLSQSYYHGYIALGGRKTCQECHMYPPGRGHRFPGAHDLDMLREGLGLDAEIRGFRYGVEEWVPAVDVEVTLINRAGHRIPDG